MVDIFSHGRMPILAFSRLHLIDPSSIEHKCLLYSLSKLHLTDNHFGFCLSMCVSVHRSVVERLRPHFFTDFHQILHAAQKCGCIERYCFWDKPEVDYRFYRCAKFNSFQFRDCGGHNFQRIVTKTRTEV